LKLSLIVAQEADGVNFWFRFDDQLRQQIKEAFLSLLCDANATIVKDAGMCLGIIATVELPLGQWDEFLQMMSANATNEDYKFRLAAVQTLGQTMEFIDQYGKSLNNTQVGQVLHSTILNIDPHNREVTKIAVEALVRAMPLTRENFVIEDQRAFIVDGLFKAAEMDDVDIQEKAMEAISDIPLVGYDTIDQMINKIGSLTMNLLQTDRYGAIKGAFGFWSNLAEVEIKRSKNGTSKNIVGNCLESLLSIILSGLVVTELDFEADS
jgi:importin subunit beta-1